MKRSAHTLPLRYPAAVGGLGEPEMTLTLEEWHRLRDEPNAPSVVHPHELQHAA
ncbi:MAG: hypothetical protein ACRDYW_10510 [Acidimicrobiales bacterium]